MAFHILNSSVRVAGWSIRVGPAEDSLESSLSSAYMSGVVERPCSQFIACIMNSKVEPNLFTERLCLLNDGSTSMDEHEAGWCYSPVGNCNFET